MRTIGSYDAKLIIEPAGGGRILQMREDTNSIVGVNEFPIRSGIVIEVGDSSTGDSLVGFAYIEKLFALCVHHPKYLLDIVGHLLKACFASPERAHRVNALCDIGKDDHMAARKVVRRCGALDKKDGAVSREQLGTSTHRLVLEKGPPIGGKGIGVGAELCDGRV